MIHINKNDNVDKDIKEFLSDKVEPLNETNFNFMILSKLRTRITNKKLVTADHEGNFVFITSIIAFSLLLIMYFSNYVSVGFINNNIEVIQKIIVVSIIITIYTITSQIITTKNIKS